LSIGLFFVGRYTALRQTGTLSSPAKSIAVLPFENLSRDPDNAYFADGVQDEILTNLARIADLKVIGRISVMKYGSGIARDLRAKQLFSTPSYYVNSKPKLLEAADLLNESVVRDPSFFRGFCQLAFVDDAFYFFGHDRTSSRLALAEAALQAASRLRPDAG